MIAIAPPACPLAATRLEARMRRQQLHLHSARSADFCGAPSVVKKNDSSRIFSRAVKFWSKVPDDDPVIISDEII
jgi:hypothetical protein